MKYYGKTDIGKVRSENQDTFQSEEIKLHCIGGTALLATVCDGMGGAAGGRFASTSACESFTKYVARQIEAFDEDLSNPSNIPFEKILRDGVKVANKTLLASAAQNDEYRGMGTTLVAALFVGDTLYCVNIGDSRAYCVSDGKLCQITHDHSYVQTLLDTGKITEQEAMYHPEKNVILKAVGVSTKADADVFKLEMPDSVLLCSDGLSNMLSSDVILSFMTSGKPAEEITEALINAANENGGPDNITAFAIFAE